MTPSQASRSASWQQLGERRSAGRGHPNDDEEESQPSRSTTGTASTRPRAAAATTAKL